MLLEVPKPNSRAEVRALHVLQSVHGSFVFVHDSSSMRRHFKCLPRRIRAYAFKKALAPIDFISCFGSASDQRGMVTGHDQNQN
jgi:hypothetical protein